jgi:exodeoxyribonuclease VII large subunit
MVADVRAPTPSAAAEVAVPDMTEIAGQLSATRRSMVSSMSGRIVAGTVSIERLTDRVLSSGPDIDTLRRNIDDLLGMATTYHKHGVEVRRERSQALSERLTSLSPYDTLRRGYAVVQRRKDGAVVGDGAHAEIGDALDITLQNANLGVDVTSVEHSPGSIAGE